MYCYGQVVTRTMNIKLARAIRVLIVDDQILAKGYLKYTMEELGFQQISYIDKADEALRLIKEETFELVVCAYDLREEKEGYFLYEQLKAHRILPLTTAFVFISSDTTAEIVHSIVELQPDEFLAKPFSVKELDKRLSRVLVRKQALKDVYALMDKGDFEGALDELERFLTEPKNAEFFPLALRTKGELLLLCEHFEEAADFYQAIINVQDFTWAKLGLVRCYLQLDKDDEAEKLILRLAFQPDAMLSAYDLLAALQIKQQEFDDALESVTLASSISPRNVHRHKQAVDLSKITHDFPAQFDAARRVVKYAKHSIHDKPENYLNVARAGIDFAMTADAAETGKLVRQTQDFIRQMKEAFPKAEVDSELKVIDARLYYLEDETDKARMLLSQLQNANMSHENTEALMDRAKAFHEVGLQEHALAILDEVERRCVTDESQSALFMHYLKQQQQEKREIAESPKALNNTAVNYFREGDVANALIAFRQAFTVMPKNPAIALNLLQTTASEIRDNPGRQTEDNKKLIFNCMKTLESATLTDEQERRYHRVKSSLSGL